MSSDRPGYISREEHNRIIEQINRARRLEQSANFESGRRYERECRSTRTGTLGVTILHDWRGVEQ